MTGVRWTAPAYLTERGPFFEGFAAALEFYRPHQARALRNGRTRYWPPKSAPRSSPWTLRDVLEALRRYAAIHDGLAPTRREWAEGNDGHPSVATVEFVARAARPPRVWVPALPPGQRCAACPGDHCSVSGHGQYFSYEADEDVCGGAGCFHCTGTCPLPDEGHWSGLSDWGWTLEQAGLEVRRAADSNATSQIRIGRNRQMVTGGRGVRPQIFDGPVGQ